MEDSVFLDSLLTLGGVIAAYLLAIGPRPPKTTAGKIVAVILPIAVLIYNQSL